MARSLNGTSDVITVPLVFNGSNVVTIGFWCYFASFTNNDLKMTHCTNEGSVGANNGFYCNPSRASAPAGGFDVVMTNPFWEDQVTRPSASVWHHVMIVHDRSVPENKVWIDGVAQSLTSVVHSAPGATFTDNTLSFGKYGATFLAFQLAEWTIWNGIRFGDGEARALADYASPLTIHPDRALAYLPFEGISPEQVVGRGVVRLSSLATLTGTTAVAHPYGPLLKPQSVLVPRRLASLPGAVFTAPRETVALQAVNRSSVY